MPQPKDSGDGMGGGGGRKPGLYGRQRSVDQHRVLKRSQMTVTLDTAGAGDSNDLPDGIWKNKDGSYDCRACKHFGFQSMTAVKDHCDCNRHIAAVLLERERLFRAEKKFVPRIQIESDAQFDDKKGEYFLSVKVGNGNEVKGTVTFTLTNISANSIFKFLSWHGDVPVSEFRFENPEPGIQLRPCEQLKLKLQLTPSKEAVHAFKIFFHFDDLNRSQPRVEVCSVKITFADDLVADLANTGGQYVYNKRPKGPSRQYYQRGHAEPGQPLPGLGERDGLEKTRPLPWFDMPRCFHQFINNGLTINDDASPSEADQLQQYKSVLDTDQLTVNNYQKRFEALLYLEEHQTTVDMEMYFMEKVRLQKHGRGNLLSLEVPGLAENRPSVLKGDHLYVRKYVGPGEYSRKEYQGIVHEVQQTRVFLGFSRNFVDSFYEGLEFCVRFTVNRLPMRLQHRALSLKEPEESDLENILFPTEDTARTHGLLLPQDTVLRFYSRSPPPNPEQERAIRHIVLGTSRPAPYIIFGPPGTGKTFTIVEAIKQVLVQLPASRVLACAPSNSAADLIAEKLLVHLQSREVYRLNAFSRSVATISDKVKTISNLGEHNEMCFPTKKELADKGIRVYVTTLITAGRLVSAEFDRDHFTHVVIDEASHATEPESLVAFAGLLYNSDTANTGKQVVLAGDPQQLGPILRSPYAKKFKLDMSMMERLMNNPLYRRRSAPGPQDGLYYDPLLITKLIRNYRSHETILRVPNHLFYNNELKACGLPELTHMMCGWDHLVNKKIPVVFHSVIGEDQQEKNSPSFFNAHEVGIVMKYVGWLVNEKSPAGTKIKEEHVGIIAPYRRQVQKIQTELRKRSLPGIKVGSVEEFQGQERQVIVVSTVRSNPRYLTTDNKFGIGFLQNDKRFNVAVTRPKALLVVIGNPNILRHNASWNAFVQFCKDNQCMVDPHLDRDKDDSYSKLMEQLKLLSFEEDDELGVVDHAMVSVLNNDEAVNRDLFQ
ncbi:putative helicase mov-10-B.1 isoform X2 [Littorina saxatilis]|uniref:RNA helicase n=2 Tax=Littorina saxatilis TaxID=31220 RepID=A0AAN9BA52_9CAEN